MLSAFYKKVTYGLHSQVIGRPDSEMFQYFKFLLLRGFIAARKVWKYVCQPFSAGQFYWGFFSAYFHSMRALTFICYVFNRHVY